jgi:hypothetical protein
VRGRGSERDGKCKCMKYIHMQLHACMSECAKFEFVFA